MMLYGVQIVDVARDPSESKLIAEDLIKGLILTSRHYHYPREQPRMEAIEIAYYKG
jgi:hypothetical protein